MANFMDLALKQAAKAFAVDEVPVGALVVKDGAVIAAAHNHNRGLNDACAHAEILAIREACIALGKPRLDGCDLYVTLEPCAMCAAAIALARIRGLYYGAGDKKFGAVENGVRFFTSNSCFHRPEVYSGINEEESRKLLQEFFAKKR